MTRWEYQVLELPYGRGEYVSELNRMGREGWEAVGMHVENAERASAPLHDQVLIVLMKRSAED